jgi:glutamate decarboxylase
MMPCRGAAGAQESCRAMPPEEELPARYGSRFFVEGVPEAEFPEEGMGPADAYNLIGEEMELDGDPGRNLATFVTTWMEPPATKMIAENLHRNFIDHAEYPRTAEIEQRCIRMLADLYNAPGQTTGARTQGSSEAIMLGALAARWRWRKHEEERRLPRRRLEESGRWELDRPR